MYHGSSCSDNTKLLLRLSLALNTNKTSEPRCASNIKKMPIIITAQQKVAGPPGCRSKPRQMFAPFPMARVMLLLFEYNACNYYSSNIGVMLLLFE